MMKDYMDNLKGMKNNMADQFDKADRANYTKTMVERLRLGRDMTGSIDRAGDEYGNYTKFENDRNQVKNVIDAGEDDDGLEKF